MLSGTPLARRARPSQPVRRPRGGFTLVELVAVLVITGILASIAAARFADHASIDAAVYGDQIRAMLRYAQKNAIAQNRPVYAVIGKGRVALCYNYQQDSSCAGANRVLAPAGSNSGSSATTSACGSANGAWLCEGAPSGVSLSVRPAAAYFYFDALGRPYASADAAGSTTSSFITTVVRLSAAGRNDDITVSQESGYVY